MNINNVSILAASKIIMYAIFLKQGLKAI